MSEPEDVRPLVLVVDDEIELCRRIARLLERGGYRALACFSVAEAEDLLATHDVSVLISDITMPVTSGLELLERVTQPDRPPIGVVMMTASTTLDGAASLGTRRPRLSDQTVPPQRAADQRLGSTPSDETRGGERLYRRSLEDELQERDRTSWRHLVGWQTYSSTGPVTHCC
ncbi:MAG: response regulator [Acidimicrobiales bacterium]